ncbi:MAG: hypothetical protein ACOX78_07335 [Lachnospiraceae bacterium]
MKKEKLIAILTASGLAVSLTACGSTSGTSTTSASASTSTTTASSTTASSTAGTTSASSSDTSSDSSETYSLGSAADSSATAYENSEDDGHAILADGEDAEYDNITVTKTGSSASSEEADFYGYNAAVLAQNGATLTITNADITTSGSHANAVFAYGEGTTVNISDSTIYTTDNNSGGLMTTGGATMNATNLTVVTEGGSSAAIRSDRGGGTVNVTGGYYESNGSGSPAIYSTADVYVTGATLVSNAAQGVVVEGSNSVTLTDTDLTADNTVKNSDNSDTYQAVMLYQSMSGDASTGTSSFTMTGGTLTSENGGMFFVTNTDAEIQLENVELTYATDDLLRIEAAGWGTDGSNGGNVTFTAIDQDLEGIITVDDISTLNYYLTDGSSYEGAINTDGEAGDVYVELDGDSTWTLTGDSYITSLTCDADSIDLNGYTLYVNGVEYTEGTASSGSAVEAAERSSSGSGSGSGSAMGVSGSAGGSALAKPGSSNS